MSRKHYKIIHFESAIQRMRFDKLSRVHSYLNDIINYAECYYGFIPIDQMFKCYNDLKLPPVSYNYDESEDWGVSLENLQHIGIYKAPKSIELIQVTDPASMNVEFLNGDEYYLVIHGVEKMEELRNE